MVLLKQHLLELSPPLMVSFFLISVISLINNLIDQAMISMQSDLLDYLK